MDNFRKFASLRVAIVFASAAGLAVCSLASPPVLNSASQDEIWSAYEAMMSLQTDANQLVADSVPLTAQQKQEIQSYINNLRQAGYTKEADRLQQALDAGKIRMGDPSQMRGVGMVTSMTGYVIINEALYNREKRTHGGSNIIKSQLLHEGLHLRQYDFLAAKEAERPGGEYNPNRMEVDAYSMQIGYLQRLYDQSQDPAVKALLKQVIDRLKLFRDVAEVKSDQTQRIKPGAFIDKSPIRSPRPLNNQTSQTSTATVTTTTDTTNMPNADSYYGDADPNSTAPEGDWATDFANQQASIADSAWANEDETLPLAVANRLFEVSGTLVSFDLKTWTDAQYRAVLGPTYDTVYSANVAEARSLPFTVRTNPAVVGKTLAQVSPGVPLFLVVSTDPARVTYGYDKDGKFVQLPSAP